MKKGNPARQRIAHSLEDDNQRAIKSLSRHLKNDGLTLYLGSGVSKGNRLPLWKELVSRLYVKSIALKWDKAWQPFPNYISALGDWMVEHSKDSPEVLSQKIAAHLGKSTTMRSELRKALYADWMQAGSESISVPTPAKLLNENPTLAAIKRLLDVEIGDEHAVSTVVSYNYDNLIELITGGDDNPFVPVFSRSHKLKRFERSCLHVHGFLPPSDEANKVISPLIFTEAEYHDASNEPYSWSNLCQIESMARQPGLMIGLSLNDRNMRRLLRAVNNTPLKRPMFAILAQSTQPSPQTADLTAIHDAAIAMLNSGMPGAQKKGRLKDAEIKEIFSHMSEHEISMQRSVLKALGITPIVVPRLDIGGIIDSLAQSVLA